MLAVPLSQTKDRAIVDKSSRKLQWLLAECISGLGLEFYGLDFDLEQSILGLGSICEIFGHVHITSLDELNLICFIYFPDRVLVISMIASLDTCFVYFSVICYLQFALVIQKYSVLCYVK